MTTPIASMTRKFSVSAAHRLHNPKLSEVENVQIYGKCNNEFGHGHNYLVSITLKGPIDPKTGMIYNLSDLKNAIEKVSSKIDHRNLDKEIDFFTENVSTTENLAVYIWNEIKEVMDKPNLLHKVTIAETEKNIFTYKGEMQ